MENEQITTTEPSTAPADAQAIPPLAPAETQEMPPVSAANGDSTVANSKPTSEEAAAERRAIREANVQFVARQRALCLESTMAIHPVCNLFPLMTEKDLQMLADDIRTNGLVHPIVVHENQVVDGRNRLSACRIASVEPRLVQWRDIYEGTMPLARWIWSVNAERRHLTGDQIAAVQVGIKAWEEQEAARQRQVDAGSRGKEGGRGHKKTLPDKRPEGFSTSTSDQPAAKRPKNRSGETAIKIAKDAGVSERKVRQALTVQKADPGLLTEVAQGSTTLREAEKKVKAKANPKSKPTKPQPRAFDLEKEIRKIMRAVDAVLDTCDDTVRAKFLAELIKTLGALK